MLLINPASASLALGTQCKTPTGVGDEALLDMLRLLTPRMEAALNVYSLARGQYTDYFKPPRDEHEYRLPFRLSNGFLIGTPTVVGVFEPGAITVNTEYGYVELDGYSYDSRTPIAITYTSGFAVPAASPQVHPDEKYRVAEGTPEWMEGVIADFLANWRRNNLMQPQVTKEYGFLPTLNEAVNRDLHTRIYGRYMRQRDGMLWSTRCVKV